MKKAKVEKKKEGKKVPTDSKLVEAVESVEPTPAEPAKPIELKSDTKTKKHHGNLFVIIFLVLLFASAIGIFAYFAFKKEFNTTGFIESRRITYAAEYQEEFGHLCYGSVFSCADVEIETSGPVDTTQLGDHEVIVTIKGGGNAMELKQTVTIVDEEAPIITTEIERLEVCPSGKVPKFEYGIKDNFDGDLTDNAMIIHDADKGNVVISIKDSNENEAKKEIPAVVKDEKSPVISLNGDEKTTAYLGVEYKDAGASVEDNCDDVELVTENKVNTNAEGVYEVIYFATDKSGNTTTVKRTVEVKKPENGIIYLTFDDGPSAYTAGLLDILKKYNVKATFFVTGNPGDDILRREYEEGHSIGLHTFTHSYSFIYQNEDIFFNDLYRVQERVKNATGFTSTLMRFPGGSSNTVSASYDGGQRIMSKLTKSVQEKGFTYFDWNISSGDAGGAYNSDQVYNNVVSRLGHGGSYVVLQHDTKPFSINAVEGIIQYGLSHGYIFMPLTPTSYTAHHGIAN